MRSSSEPRDLIAGAIFALVPIALLLGLGWFYVGREQKHELQRATDRQWAIDQADLAECVVALSQEPSLGTIDWAAHAALNAGRDAQAEEWAQQLLDMSTYGRAEDWMYGNAIHDGHAILGRVALQRGDRRAAIDHLLAAGTTPGSPQLKSFGPNVVLARDLLALGEKDVVLAYFDQCQWFWTRGGDELLEWRQAIAREELPDFGANLAYGG
jgi:hypothetical protein